MLPHEDPSSSSTTGRGRTARLVGFSSSSSSVVLDPTTSRLREQPEASLDDLMATRVADHSDTSSDDFHAYAGVFGPPALCADGHHPYSHTSSQNPRHESWSHCVEPIDAYGQRADVAQAPTVASWGSRWWSAIATRSVDLVARVLSAPESRPQRVSLHTDHEAQQMEVSQYEMALHPDRISTSYVRNRLHCRDPDIGELGDTFPVGCGEVLDGHEPFEYDHQAMWVDNEDMVCEMSLGEGIVQYINNPNEYYGNIVSALLSTRDPETNPVSAEDIQLTGGNQYLVMLILQSGALPLVYDSLIARELQLYLDRLLAVAGRNGRTLPPTCFEYLKCLVSAPSQCLTAKQARLFRRSGFEFASLLHDYPHLVGHLPYTCSGHMWKLLGRTLDLPLALLGLLLICLDFLSLGLVVWYWYNQSSSYGYITLLCYLGGYVADMMTLLFVMRKKASSNVYEGRVTPFPSIHLKMFPAVPIYEFVLLSSIVRHEWDASRENGGRRFAASGGNKHRAMIHDLYATATIGRVGHSVCYSAPQAIVQSYFFDWGTLGAGDPSFFGYRMLLVSSIACVFLALVLFMRQIVVFDSVSSMGYASFATEGNGVIVRRSSVLPRTLTFALLYLFEINAFFLVIGFLNVHVCSTNTAVWIAMSAGVVVSCLVIYIFSVVTSSSVHRAAKWFVVPIALETACTIFMTVRRADTKETKCPLFVHAGQATAIVGYVMWGVFGVLGALWLLSGYCGCLWTDEDDSGGLDEHPPMPGSATKPTSGV